VIEESVKTKDDRISYQNYRIVSKKGCVRMSRKDYKDRLKED